MLKILKVLRVLKILTILTILKVIEGIEGSWSYWRYWRYWRYCMKRVQPSLRQVMLCSMWQQSPLTKTVHCLGVISNGYNTAQSISTNDEIYSILFRIFWDEFIILNFCSGRIKKKTFNKLGKYDQKFLTLLTYHNTVLGWLLVRVIYLPMC